MKKIQQKKIWKNIFQGKYAVEKAIDAKPHPHVLKKIGDLKTSMQYIDDLKQILKLDPDKVNNSDNIRALLSIPKAISQVGLTDEDTEIYFAYMNDKYWYPKDANDKEAVESYWLDTVVIKCTDAKKLEELLKHFDYDWDKNDRMISKLTGKVITGDTFDEIDLVEFPNMRHSGKKDALRLWLD